MDAVVRGMRVLATAAATAVVVASASSIAMHGPIVEPSPYVATSVVNAFPGDVVATDWGGNDHGWWYFEVDPRSGRDSRELCEAILDEMAAQGEWGWPGIGVEVATFDWQDGRRIRNSRTSVYCGHPDLLGRQPLDA